MKNFKVISNIEITKSMEEAIEEKLNKFDKLYKTLEFKVTITYIKERFKVDVLAKLPKYQVKAEALKDNYYDALATAVAKLEKQILKHKDKLIEKRTRAKEDLGKAFIEEETKLEEQVKSSMTSKIQKEKQLDLSADENILTVDEAIFQCELLGHDFFIFSNLDRNKKISVIYLRTQEEGQPKLEDNSYGIINLD